MSIGFFLLLLLLLVIISPGIKFLFDKAAALRLKGILSILIIAHHTNGGGIIDGKWGIVIVSMFLFVSGYGLMKSFCIKGEAYLKTFFKRRFIRLLPPLAIVTFGYMMVWSMSGHGSIQQWATVFMSTGIPPIGATWYVYCALVLYLIFYIAMKICKERLFQTTLLALSALLFIGIIKYIFRWDDFWWCSIVAFVVGVVYAIKEDIVIGLINVSGTFRKLAAILLVLLCMSLVLYRLENMTAYLYVFINVLPIGLVFVIYHFGIPDIKPLSFLGSISYELYIVHDVFISFLYTFGVGASITRFIVVLVLSIPSAIVLKKVCNRALRFCHIEN